MEFTPPPPLPPAADAVGPDGSGPAAPAKRRRRLPHAAMAGGLVFGMALGGAGIAFAAGSGSGTNTTNPPNGAPPAAGRHPSGHFGGRAGALGLGGFIGGKLLYGQATVQTPSGATKTIDFQVGTVQSVDSGHVTVTTGSHTATYTVQPSTIVDAQAGGIGTVKSNDKVIVIAEDNGSKSTPTAMDIRDQTQMQSTRHGLGFGGTTAPGATTPGASTSGVFGNLQ